MLAVFGALCIATALSIRDTARVTGERKSEDHVGVFIVGIALLCLALVVAVVTYIVSQAMALP